MMKTTCMTNITIDLFHLQMSMNLLLQIKSPTRAHYTSPSNCMVITINNNPHKNHIFEMNQHFVFNVWFR